MKIPAVALHFGVGATLSIGIAFALSSYYEVSPIFKGSLIVCVAGMLLATAANLYC